MRGMLISSWAVRCANFPSTVVGGKRAYHSLSTRQASIRRGGAGELTACRSAVG